VYNLSLDSTGSGNHYIQVDGAQTNYLISNNTTGSVRFLCRNDSGTNIFDLTSATGVLKINQWQYVVGIRNAATASVYVDGARVATGSATVSTSTGTTLYVGANVGSSRFFNGYMANARIISGSLPSGYDPTSTTIAVPTTPLTAVTNTRVLLNMANAGIYDAAAQNDVTTAGSAVTAVTPAKWSPSSMSFNGSNSYAQVLSNPAFTLGTSNFTIEFWVYFNSVAAAQTVVGRHITTAAGDWAIYTASTGSLNYYLSSNGSTWNLANQVSIGSISTGTWYYVALVRNGSVFTPYIGTTPGSAPTAGTTTTTASALYANTQALTVGAANNSLTFLNGYVQDFRFTVGVARSITTVPSAALPTK
jgi:hypothetical protein